MNGSYPRKLKFIGGPIRKRRQPDPSPSAQKAAARKVGKSGITKPSRNERGSLSISSHTTPINTDAAPLIEDARQEEPQGIEAPDHPLSPGTSLPMPFYTSPQDLFSFFGAAESSMMNPFFDPCPGFPSPPEVMTGQLPLSDPLNLTAANVQPCPDPRHTHCIGVQSKSPPSAPRPQQGLTSSVTESTGQLDDAAASFSQDTAPGEKSTRSHVIQSWIKLIARYNKEFCVLPLTHDFEANPFRQDIDSCDRSELLLHCILALSYKHLDHDSGNVSKEARHHKARALQLLNEMERDPNPQDLESKLLDAVLILMTLDCATSAHGPWTSYLQRARVILEAAGRFNLLQSPRVKAQVGMLVWWDVTLALTNRQGCVLSDTTIRSQLTVDKPEVSSSSSPFYSISGCPEDLFRYMIQLSTYAREFELTSTMTCATFDMEHVLNIERDIHNWSSPDYQDLPGWSEDDIPCSYESEEEVQYHQDLYHCAEAWKFALLLYIERVFKLRVREQSAYPQARPRNLGFLARKTLNHVSSCRKNLLVQKQLLLPVFLAGCETEDECLRCEARDYCRWWNEETRYDMFLTAAGLLQEVWDSNDPQAWWGSVIDQKSGAASRSGRQYLFG